MIAVSTREFRDNQRKYLDLVDTERRIVIHRGRTKSYAIIPLDELEAYLAEPANMEAIHRGIAQMEAGEGVTIDVANIWKSL